MITDFPKKPFPLPRPEVIEEELALFGGLPVIPRGHRRTVFPVITKEDLFQMLLALGSNPNHAIETFETAYRSYVGANWALSTSSGTASLHVALVGAGIDPGDEVIVPAFTFIATAHAVLAAGAIPIFVDIDPDTYCISPQDAERAVTARTRAVMPVHVHGLPADILALEVICGAHDLLLVEDASHAHSARAGERMCGSIGDAAGQSLMADKNLPVGGEGGIAFFKAEESFARAIDFLKSSGIDYRMAWPVAAFGISQLERLAFYDRIRARNGTVLASALQETGLFSPPFVPEGSTHAYNMYRIKIHPEAVGLEDLPPHGVKAALGELLRAEGLPVREWQNTPIPWHSPFQNLKGFGDGYPFSLSDREDLGYARSFPNTLRMFETTLVLCRELRSPVEYERVLGYGYAFQKVAKRPDAVRKLVSENDYPLPYRTDARLG
jgi:dTDP-4-amino-4,6-dideoxygalactose transaminase